MPASQTVDSTPVRIRHISKVSDGAAGATTVLDRSYLANDFNAINGLPGFTRGDYLQLLQDAGAGNLLFPNDVGGDGTLHRDRFAIIVGGRRTAPTPLVASGSGSAVNALAWSYGGGSYRPGDEFVEVWRGFPGAGDLLFVGTPLKAGLTRTELALQLADPFWLQRKTRETAAGYWRHAPRDVLEHYLRTWTVSWADDMSTRSRFSFFDSNTPQASAASGTWSSGAYQYVRCEEVTQLPSAVRIRSTASAQDNWVLQSQNSISVGLSATDPFMPWRAEIEFKADFVGSDIGMRVGVAEVGSTPASNAGGTVAEVHIYYDAALGNVRADPCVRTGATTTIGGSGGSLVGGGAVLEPLPGPYRVVIEGRGEWIWFYVNGDFVGCLGMPAGPYTVGCRAWQSGGGTGTASTGSTCDVTSMLLRRGQRLLCQGVTGANPENYRGDYYLPGVPPTGGLLGDYFDDGDLSNDTSIGNYRKNPSRIGPGYRVDPGPTAGTNAGKFAYDTAVNAWLPAQIPVGYARVFWTGAIYLDLANSDYYVSVETGATANNNTANVFIGKTRVGERYVNSTNGVATGSIGLRAHLDQDGSASKPYVSGWYPIVVELMNGTGGGASTAGVLKLYKKTTNAAPGAADLVTADQLSPVGIVNQQIRFDSHYDAFRQIADTFGYQYTCAPESLESGRFPGSVVPKQRVGRDTEKILDELEGDGIGAVLGAEEVADFLVVDCQGLSTDKQVVLEGINYGQANKHLFAMSEYDQAADTSYRQQALIRASSLLALRGSVWEEAQATPAGVRELLNRVDRTTLMPISGTLAEFYWQPGDAVTLQLPRVSLNDRGPRQILQVQREFRPGGLHKPQIGFRQRPRNFRDVVRKLRRDFTVRQRSYQGQLITVDSDIQTGGVLGSGQCTLAMPPRPSKIRRVHLVVMAKSDASAWNVQVNGVSLAGKYPAITKTGRFDITQFVANDGTKPRFQAGCITNTGTIQYMIEMEHIR